MRFGLTEEQWKILLDLVISPLKTKGCRVYIFGSRVTQNFHSHSDVDILYSPESELPSGFIGKINESIEESRFPFRVDLVRESELARSYRDSVMKNRVEV